MIALHQGRAAASRIPQHGGGLGICMSDTITAVSGCSRKYANPSTPLVANPTVKRRSSAGQSHRGHAVRHPHTEFAGGSRRRMALGRDPARFLPCSTPSLTRCSRAGILSTKQRFPGAARRSRASPLTKVLMKALEMVFFTRKFNDLRGLLVSVKNPVMASEPSCKDGSSDYRGVDAIVSQSSTVLSCHGRFPSR
jgi:hypothetical protein